MGKIWLSIGAFLAMLSVILGAFGAHALKEILEPEKMKILGTANQYLAYHALALLILGLWNQQEKSASTFYPGLFFLSGTFLFTGSLYIVALLDIRAAGMITPIGGVLFILGWFGFGMGALRSKA